MNLNSGVEGGAKRPGRRCGEFNLIELGVPHPLLGGRKLDFESAKAIADGFVEDDDEVTVRKEKRKSLTRENNGDDQPSNTAIGPTETSAMVDARWQNAHPRGSGATAGPDRRGVQTRTVKDQG